MPCCTNQTQVESLYYNKDVVGTAKKCDLQFIAVLEFEFVY